MRIEGIVREADYIRSQYLHLRPRPVLAALGILILGLLIWALLSVPGWILPAAVAYLSLVFLVILPYRGRRNYRQYKALSEPTTIELRDEGIFFKRTNGEGLLPWSQIIKWRESKTLVLLYPANNMFHLVPRHFFATPDAFATFKEALRSRVGSAR